MTFHACPAYLENMTYKSGDEFAKYARFALFVELGQGRIQGDSRAIEYRSILLKV